MGRDSASEAWRPETAGLVIGRWFADPVADTLTLDGQTVKLEPRTMRLLVALAERPGEVCRGQDLLDKVWAGVIVTDQSLYQAIGELRSVLKADTTTGEFIATVPRKGYRLVAPVRRPLPPVPDPVNRPADAPATPPARTVAVLPFRDLGLPAALSFLPEALCERWPGTASIRR